MTLRNILAIRNKFATPLQVTHLALYNSRVATGGPGPTHFHLWPTQ